MPRVSRYRLSQKELLKLNFLFYNLITSLRSNSETMNFLEDFLTKEEKLMLSKRLMIFLLLRMGLEAKDICEIVHVSYETVRSHRMNYDTKNNIFHKKVEYLIKKEEFKEFADKLAKFFSPINLMLEAKTNIKSRAKLLSSPDLD